MFQGKTLIVCSFDSRDTIGELPRVFKRAGLHITIMCSAALRPFISSYHDDWIAAEEDPAGLIARVARLVADNPAAYDWVILGDDHLLRALADAPLDPALKARIGPVGEATRLGVLGSKAASAALCAELGIQAPPFRVCRDFATAPDDAACVGFPLMIKIDRSSGGTGVFLCRTAQDIEHYRPQLAGQVLLIEKFIEGDTVSVEPLYREGRLLGYCYALMELMIGNGISMRRRYGPCPALQPSLEKIGAALRISGFANVTLMREIGTGRHYLVEFDLRPNAWAAYGAMAGVDFAALLRHYHAGAPLPVPQAQPVTLSLYHREFAYFLNRRHWRGLFYWARNRNRCWRTIPLYDLPLLRARTREFFWPAMRAWRNDFRAWLGRRL